MQSLPHTHGLGFVPGLRKANQPSLLLDITSQSHLQSLARSLGKRPSVQRQSCQQQRLRRSCSRIAATADFISCTAHTCIPSEQLAAVQLNPVVGDLAEGLEAPIQLLYLLALLGFLAAGAYLVVRQVFVRRDLEEAAKVLGERIRSDAGNAEDFFELGVILLRKKLFTQATRNLEKAKKSWQGEEGELAKVHNALGFAYFNMDKSDLAVSEYKRAVQLQPGYVTAWNNLGNAYEKASKIKDAYEAYKEALSYAPTNSTAKQRSEALQGKL